MEEPEIVSGFPASIWTFPPMQEDPLIVRDVWSKICVPVPLTLVQGEDGMAAEAGAIRKMLKKPIVAKKATIGRGDIRFRTGALVLMKLPFMFRAGVNRRLKNR